MKRLRWTDELGLTVEESDIPASLRPEADEARATLVERVAETDDALTHRFLEGGETPNEELKAALRRATIAGAVPAGANRPNTILLDPVLVDNLTDAGKATLKAWQSVPGMDPLWPLSLSIQGWTTYDPNTVPSSCKGA